MKHEGITASHLPAGNVPHHAQSKDQYQESQFQEMPGSEICDWDLPLSPSSYLYKQNFETASVSPSNEESGSSVNRQDISTTFTSPEIRGSAAYERQALFNSNHLASNDGSCEAVDLGSVCDTRDGAHENMVAPVKKKRRFSMPASSLRRASKQANGLSRRKPSLYLARTGESTDPSSASLEYRLASSTNKSLISGSLLKIYHDSMENALSCWLTEKTCPYDVEVRPYLHTFPQKVSRLNNEWGSSWSNRIYERVCNLDKACTSLRGRTLTRSENNAVNLALRKTVMSFATQWAYSSSKFAGFCSLWKRAHILISWDLLISYVTGRSSATFPDSDNLHNETEFSAQHGAENKDVDYRTEFDRSMQEMLWYEAKDSLEETADITSFRLVFANIIFALTQRPFDVTQSLCELKVNNVRSNNSSDSSYFAETANSSAKTATSPDKVQTLLDRIFDLEGPPIYLEKALRQMFSYRCKLEKLESQERVNFNKTTGMSEIESSVQLGGPLNIADRQTFNLLYWLAVMFDTLSAAINKRPLVVCDEDSDILRDNVNQAQQRDVDFAQLEMFSPPENSSPFGFELASSSESELWGGFFFQHDHSLPREEIRRWPCSHEDAASTLSDAAPIKVVLFRRVTRLQTLLSRRKRPNKIESAIGDALMVHDYWNTKYGPFFRDCIAYHETLPPRIQSWYVVLAGHWHLAGLLLADLIEEIDDKHAGLEIHRATRFLKELVKNLRLHNAFTISDLSRCSCPHPESSFSQASEFHSAVNNGALLTEPWTEVLIQSFSKACSVLLDMFPRSNSDLDFRIDLFESRCESCVKALWYLGKKSDIALMASSILSEALQKAVQVRKEENESQLLNYDLDLMDGGSRVHNDMWDGGVPFASFPELTFASLS
jgi:hypothetical protein